MLDILHLERLDSDRDLHITTPILIYLNKKYNVSYKTKNIYRGSYYLLKYKPKLLLVPNCIGSNDHHMVVKRAKQLGIKVVSLISEGNVLESDLDQFLWGWNKERHLYADRLLVWNKNSENLFKRKYPELNSSIITVGATGFDRYELLKFKTKKNFLNHLKLDNRYKKVIGIASWGFDHYFEEYYERFKDIIINHIGQEQVEMHRMDLFGLQKIYKLLVTNNPDVLFVLRYHPWTMSLKHNEFYGLEKFDNVYISKGKKSQDFEVSDLINISDLWIGYETTTSMEAWLLDKVTFLVNPTTTNFTRGNTHLGSPIVKTYSEAQGLIDEYYSTGKINTFEELAKKRTQIIKNVIEFDDGKNHSRAGEEIYRLLNDEPEKIRRTNPKLILSALRQILESLGSKVIKLKRWEGYNLDESIIDRYIEMYYDEIKVK